jgi:very-short-patch-repair endonuclease
VRGDTPHPPAARAPSPARGEGKASAPSRADEGSASGNRVVAAPPSPLAGEGARRADEGSNKSDKIAFARDQRRNMTDAERKLWHLLRGRRFSGVKFRRQMPVGRYVVDFVCLEQRLVIEADGSQHAESRHDAARDRWLEGQGFRIRRFWNPDILTTPRVVADTIWHDLNPDPTP